MHGFADLDLSDLVGRECIQVQLGLHQVRLCFHGGGVIGCEGRFRLLNASGEVVETDESGRDGSRLPALLGSSLDGFEVQSRDRLALRFTNRWSLILDDSEGYESVSIEHEDGRIDHI